MAYLLGILADKFHPLRLGLLTMALFIGVTLGGGILMTDARSCGAGLIAYGVLSGSGHTATASLTLRLFPRARFAQLDSARGLVSSLGMMLVGPLMGRFLDRTGNHYQHVYLASGMLALLALLSGLMVYRYFLHYGGIKNYVPPE